MKKKVKVLVVDDEAIIPESLRNWLSDVGHQVLVAENGSQALAVMEREKASVAIVDLVVPVKGTLLLLSVPFTLSRLSMYN